MSIIHPSFWSSQQPEAQVYNVVARMLPEARLPLLVNLIGRLTPGERRHLREILEADLWQTTEDD
jgi:hypothetical protein